MIKKNIYKWHRIASLIIALPLFLWALSGFLHPIMTNLRPAMKTQSVPTVALNSNRIQKPLQAVLSQNNIDSIYSVRLVQIDTNWFYQVKTNKTGSLQYISAKNGQILVRGDWLYAQYLARIFLEGPLQHDPNESQASKQHKVGGMSSMMDCCGEATSTVLNYKRGAPISGASLVNSFDEEYKRAYCLLPVYKVAFKRSDGIRLYVETAQDRFAVAVDDTRAAFTTFFNLMHTWAWLDFLGKGRIWIEIFFTGLAFLTALMGIYIFFTTKSKTVKGNTLVKARRNHRYTSIIAALFTLMFTFSGCYHAFNGLNEEHNEIPTIQHAFASSSINFDINRLEKAVQQPVVNIGLVQIQGKAYWQVYLQNDNHNNHPKDLMKAMSADNIKVVYLATDDYKILPKGDEIYARYLAGKFSGHQNKSITSTELITKFTDEYNFTDKRLPVWKINYASGDEERLYVETSTGVLAKRTNDLELYEGYSFALFHKHHYMDFAGKTTRDISTMVGAALQIILVIVGLVLYFRWRKRKRASKHA